MSYYPWIWPRPYFYYPYPVMPFYDPALMLPAMTPSYQSMFYQYPHQYYQQQGMRGPGLGTDIAGIPGLGGPRWLALPALMGY